MTDVKLVALDNIDTEKLGLGELIGSCPEQLTCYFGYRPNDIRSDIFCYALCVGFRPGKTDSFSFVKLENGALLRTYKPESGITKHYHAPDLHLRLPSGSQCLFGVVSKDTGIDRAATEKAFGFTQEDLEELVGVYCRAMGIKGYREGRVTFSKTRDNFCDLTGASIPREFPYLTFSDSSFIWSHVSLYGFYCHLAFLLHKGARSVFYELMQHEGARDEWLVRLREIPTRTTGSPVIAHFQ